MARLVSLTYAPPQPVDPVVVRRDVVAFLKRLRVSRPGLAYVYVLERHKSGALHVHVAVSGDGRRIDKGWIERAWSHGWVDVRRVKSRRPGGREASRAIARYVSKYVTKDPVRSGPGGHRYELRQGLQPVVVRAVADAIPAGWDDLVRLAGGELPAYQWESSSSTDWTGPPVTFLSWS